VKETDRIRTTAALVNALGGHAEELEDGLRIVGVGRLFGAECDSGGDHRIAMAAAVAGLVAEGETRVLNAECIATSFPGFAELMEGLHA
jgi:3-phosphoshikimate 1-carboxyvinyltransferase